MSLGEAPVIPPVPKDLKCKHENITNDKQLQGAQHKSNFTLVENVDSMGECMKKCCDSTNCDVAYFVGKKCYSVVCSNKEACKLVSSKPSKDSPLLSTMLKAEKELKTGEVYSHKNVLCLYHLFYYVFHFHFKESNIWIVTC